MECQFLVGSSPLLRRWHRIVCKECRDARAADATLIRGINRLVNEPAPMNGLELALSSVGTAPSRKPRRSVRWLFALSYGWKPATALSCLGVAGAAGWFAYADMDPKIAIPERPHLNGNAYQLLEVAASAIPAKEKSQKSLNGSVSTDYSHSDLALALSPRQLHRSSDTTKGPMGATSRAGGARADDVHIFSLAEKRKILSRYFTSQSWIRRGFAYPFQGPLIASFYESPTYWGEANQLARTFALETQVKTESGDIGGACESALDGIEFGAQLSTSADYRWVGESSEALARARLWPLIDRLTGSQAKEAARRLEKIDAKHLQFGDLLSEERWSMIARLETAYKRSDWRTVLLGLSSAENSTRAGIRVVSFLYMAPYTKTRIMSDYSNVMLKEIRLARQPYTTANESEDPEKQGLHNVVLANLLPSYAQQRFNHLRSSEAPTAMLLAALAVRAYEVDHHRLPDHLSSLVPQYLKSIPADPFGHGTPIGYLPLKHPTLDSKGQVVWLYSIGPDGKNDGGKPIERVFKTGSPIVWSKLLVDTNSLTVNTFSQGDIVAGVNGI